jgi:hypothetical protein
VEGVGAAKWMTIFRRSFSPFTRFNDDDKKKRSIPVITKKPLSTQDLSFPNRYEHLGKSSSSTLLPGAIDLTQRRSSISERRQGGQEKTPDLHKRFENQPRV